MANPLARLDERPHRILVASEPDSVAARRQLAQAELCVAQLQACMSRLQRNIASCTCVDGEAAIGADLLDTMTQADAQWTLLRAHLVLLVERERSVASAALADHGLHRPAVPVH